MAVKQGFLMYYTKGDAIGTKVSVRYRESGRLSGVVVKRGFTVYTKFCANPQKFQVLAPRRKSTHKVLCVACVRRMSVGMHSMTHYIILEYSRLATSTLSLWEWLTLCRNWEILYCCYARNL